MSNNYVIALLFFFSCFCAWNKDFNVFERLPSFKVNDTLYTYNATTLYSEPKLNGSKKMNQLTMGDLLLIDSINGLIPVLDTLSNQEFLAVKQKNRSGYVMVQDLAIASIQLDQIGTSLLIQWPYLKAQLSDSLHIKALTEIRTTSEVALKQLGDSFFFSASTNRGLADLKSIASMNFSSSKNDSLEGVSYVAWDGEKLMYIGSIQSFKNDTSSVSEIYIFPTDEEGKENTLIFKRNETLIIDPLSKWTKSNQEYRELKWDGSVLR